MNKEKTLNLLGIAMKAGKIISGEELTLREVRSKKAKIVFVAADASENTLKKMQDKCLYYQVPCILTFNQAEISHAIGRSRMICGVCDQGFAKKMQELMKD